MASITRSIAGCFRSLTLIQSGERLPRGRSRRFDTRPFRPMVQARPKQVRTNLALLIACDEDAVGSAGKQPRPIGLAQAQWQSAQILAI
jgi:hypothetical protein